MNLNLKSYVGQVAGSSSVRTLAWMGLGLMVAIATLSFWSARRYQKSATWRDHSAHVLDRMFDTQLAMRTAESAQRGFVLTGNDLYLKNYEAYRDETLRDLDDLEDMVRDNGPQSDLIASVRTLTKAKIDFMDRMVGLSGTSPADAVKIIRNGEGHRLMEEINSYFVSFEARERELLDQRTAKAEKEFGRATWLVSLGLLFSFILLLISKVQLHYELKMRECMVADLAVAETKAKETSDLKSSFLANMSHEIRTPLNGIVGMVKLLENTGLTAEQRDFLETMKVSSNSLLTLINQVLDFSKIESGKMQLEEAPFQLFSLIQGTVSIVDYAAATKNLKIVTRVSPDVPEFYLGDALRLRQVLLNLLNNAVKFSEKGTIQLNVTRGQAWDSRVGLNFEVIDEGLGIDDEVKAKLFQTFTQGDESTSRRFGGSGLGLAISKQIVEMMDGTIGVESVPGNGSRFHFQIVLKLSKFRADAKKDSAAEMKTRALSAHLLIAEDNRVNQKVVSEMMKMLGCTVKMVINGKEVLKVLPGEKFDLILMDGQMPEMDGYEATRRIRKGEAGEEARLIPIIATTANAIKGDIERCLEAGMNDYIGKPISYDDLAYKVEKWLKRGRQLIDRDATDRMIALGKSSGTDLLPGLIELFESESSAALEQINQALEQNDFETIFKIAHSLKSSAANLGAVRLRDVAQRIEQAKSDPSAKHLSILIAAARTEYAGALRELKENFLKS